MGIFSKIFPSENERELKKLRKTADKVVALESKYASLSDKELQAVTPALKERLSKGETLDDILPDAFAAIREAAFRVIKQKPYYVQVMGGIALHQGRICQMATGEGKTLVSTLPAYLNALAGKGVHVVTVNDYLANFHCEWMGKIHRFMGLTVGVVLPKMTVRQKQASYACDITYGTNTEFGFDYLRDNMAMSKSRIMQRELDFAIIDEVDSILIDEARTPLIISGQGDASTDDFKRSNRFVRSLKPEDYEVDEKLRTVRLSDSGVQKAEKFYDIENLGDIENTAINHYINQSLYAHTLKQRDTDYIVENGEIVIVDEFTGRKMEGRRYSNGLHQALEAKENVRIQEENQTLATISYQNLFRLYRKLSGMTGTAKTEEGEFNSIYNLDVVVIPPNKPCVRKDEQDVVYGTHEGKIRAIIRDIKDCHEKGRPVLVGTVSVARSEELSADLKKEGVPHTVLNAKYHEKEAEIVAQAGRVGSVTIATNMAGRGTDILLGGNPEFLAKEEMQRLDYTVEQVEIASSYVEGDEETRKLQSLYRDLLAKYETLIKGEKQKVVELGGLRIIGTERHESRRIDDQLRGRSGRQGDPGSSIFYISLDDDLVRLFGEEKIAMAKRLYGSLSQNDDTPISLGIISKAIENAQKAVEANNFAVRKRVLQYDDVFNLQRNVIYAERRKVINGENIHSDITDMLDFYCDFTFDKVMSETEKMSDANIAELNKSAVYYFPGASKFFTEEDKNRSKDDLRKEWTQTIREFYNERREDTRSIGVDPDEIERHFLLRNITTLWMYHIDRMDELKDVVRLQSYAQRDPVIEYKIRGYDLFEEMQQDIKFNTIRFLLFTPIQRNLNADTEKNDIREQPENGEKDFNARCTCGSGKRYKDCCGKAEYEEYMEKQRKLRREERKQKQLNARKG